MNNKTNILVQYDGGGYDGCIWEWNYFYIDKEGEFHDIFSSGIGGIIDKTEALHLIQEEKNTFSSRVYIYNLENKKEIESFSRESSPVNIFGVLQWFDNYNDPDVELFAVCSECENEIQYSDGLSLEDWRGAGGIMSTADSLVCFECYSLGECGRCGEYVGKDNTIFLDNESKWNQGDNRFDEEYKNKAAISLLEYGCSDVCDSCLEIEAEQIESDDHEELLFQSLATGSPDMFSDDMRWVWGG